MDVDFRSFTLSLSIFFLQTVTAAKREMKNNLNSINVKVLNVHNQWLLHRKNFPHLLEMVWFTQ